METFIARQAIFNKKQEVFAYEVLFRTGTTNRVEGTVFDGDTATRTVMVNAMLEFGMKKLVSDKKAFINFTEQNILSGDPELLPKETVYVEILENVQPTTEIVDAVKNLKKKGYKIVLDDFVFDPGYEPLIELADIIKVDFIITNTPEERQRLRELIPGRVHLLAEKIETADELRQAIDFGYTLFQGYFFCKPIIMKQEHLSTNMLSKMRLLREINRREFSFQDIADIIATDTTLVHKLLTYINSPGIGLIHKIADLKQAASMLGIEGMRRWVTLVGLQTIADDKPSELFTLSLMRAKFCELVARKLKRSALSPDTSFILGMFSLLDAMTNQPMDALTTELNLTPELSDALLGKTSPLRSLLDLSALYERGEWDKVINWCEREKISPDELNKIYDQSVDWYNALNRAGA